MNTKSPAVAVYFISSFNDFSVNLNECKLDEGFPLIGGMILIILSILVLLEEIYPAYQRFLWYYKPLKDWTRSTFTKNIKQLIWLKINVLPFPQMTMFILVLLTSPPLFGRFPFCDSTHFSFVAVRY
jgi:hypothetical protein